MNRRRDHTPSICACGAILVPVPTCAVCDEQWIGHNEAVLLDAAARIYKDPNAPRPCLNNVRDGFFCARDVGHPPPCSMVRS